MKIAIVTGAGGFIGSHYVSYLKQKRYKVIGIDVKYPEFSTSSADKFILADLRDPKLAQKAISPVNELYMFAAEMGGMGYIDSVHAKIMHDNSLINSNTLESVRLHKISKVFFASSACIYPKFKQKREGNNSLKETDALPAEPDSMYGWEKLFSEFLCLSYAMDYRINVRIARFHNIYGPEGTYQGGREKSPAAICRKIAEAKDGMGIEVWGDGEQARSYCYIDDCCEGIYRLMQSGYSQPLNIGSSELVTVNQLVDYVSRIAGKKVKKNYDTSKPQGVRGRNSDNTMIRKVLQWEPKIKLIDGLRQTYLWIEDEVQNQRAKNRSNKALSKKRGIS